MTKFAQRGLKDLALRREPMGIGASFLAAALKPKMISALADSIFNVLHRRSPIYEWSPRVPSFSEKAGGRYTDGFARTTAGLTARFRRFVSESMHLDG
jgi:hypothetical protein